MEPKQLLIDTMGFLWNWMQNNDYIFFVLAVVVIVIVCKIIKASLKTIIKVGLVVVAIYLLKSILGL